VAGWDSSVTSLTGTAIITNVLLYGRFAMVSATVLDVRMRMDVTPVVIPAAESDMMPLLW